VGYRGPHFPPGPPNPSQFCLGTRSEDSGLFFKLFVWPFVVKHTHPASVIKCFFFPWQCRRVSVQSESECFGLPVFFPCNHHNPMNKPNKGHFFFPNTPLRVFSKHTFTTMQKGFELRVGFPKGIPSCAPLALYPGPRKSIMGSFLQFLLGFRVFFSDPRFSGIATAMPHYVPCRTKGTPSLGRFLTGHQYNNRLFKGDPWFLEFVVNQSHRPPDHKNRTLSYVERYGPGLRLLTRWARNL